MEKHMSDKTVRKIRICAFGLVGVCLVLLALFFFFKMRRLHPQETTVSRDGTSITFVREDLNGKSAEDIAFSLEDQPFTPEQLEKIRTVLESEKTNVSPNGTLTYFNALNVPTETPSTLDWTESQAIEQAKQYLTDLGLLPQKDFLIKTTADVQESMESGSADTIGWTIWFYQTYDGVPVVSAEDNGILMTISAQGIGSLQYNWKTITSKKGAGAHSHKLSEKEAIDRYCDQLDWSHVTADTKIAYRPVYVCQGDETAPAWVFGMEEAFLEPTYIYAFTGEVL